MKEKGLKVDNRYDPDFQRLSDEMLLFIKKQGWKTLCGFLVSWMRNNKPDDSNYTLKSYFKED